MKSKKSILLLSLLIIPLVTVLYQKIGTKQEYVEKTAIASQVKTEVVKPELKASSATTEKYKDEFIIFFSGNMADPTTQQLFYDEHENVQYLGEGNFPGVSVVKIEKDVEETLDVLKQKDYIDLVIKNQDGLDCHTN